MRRAEGRTRTIATLTDDDDTMIKMMHRCSIGRVARPALRVLSSSSSSSSSFASRIRRWYSTSSSFIASSSSSQHAIIKRCAAANADSARCDRLSSSYPRCSILADPPPSSSTSSIRRYHSSSSSSSSSFAHNDTPSWPPSTATIYQLSSGFSSIGSSTSSSSSSSMPSAVGVAIIRISGPLSRPLMLTLTMRNTDPKPRMATRASLSVPKMMDNNYMRHFERMRTAQTIDDASPSSSSSSHSPDVTLLDSDILIILFPAPHSFTGEDVVELHVHGTPLVVQSVFNAIERINRTLMMMTTKVDGDDIDDASMMSADDIDSSLSLSSAPSIADPLHLSRLSSLLSSAPFVRLAHAGEFTRRAFGNGKLDLTQVEALGDLLLAETTSQQSQALRQMTGELGRMYTQWRLDLLNALAYVEAILDFAEDEADVGEAEILSTVVPKVRSVRDSLQSHLSDRRRGELVRNGVSIVIVGAPNVGKSTLINVMTQRNVAIVSPVPGTTRDIVESRINIGGWVCSIADTAGLRAIRHNDARMISDQGSSDAIIAGHEMIEAEGMQRTRDRTSDADIKLVLLDGSTLLVANSDAVVDDQILSLIDADTIVVWTKMDLLPQIDDVTLSSSSSSSALPLSSPSASSTGRAKLIASQRYYADNHDAFTLRQSSSIANACASSSLHAIIAKRCATMVFIATTRTTTTANTDQAKDASTTTSKGMQTLMTAIENHIRRIAGIDASVASQLSSSSSSSSSSPISSSSLPLITRNRHRVHVASCLSYLSLFESYMMLGDIVLAAEQLRLATREMGAITGRVDVEELLDVIFEDFCIGK